jgi:hypothetical protein
MIFMENKKRNAPREGRDVGAPPPLGADHTAELEI